MSQSPDADEDADGRRRGARPQRTPRRKPRRWATTRATCRTLPGRGDLPSRRRQRYITRWLGDATEDVALRPLGCCERIILAAGVYLAGDNPQSAGRAGARPTTKIGPVAAAFERFQQRLARLRLERRAAIGEVNAGGLPGRRLSRGAYSGAGEHLGVQMSGGNLLPRGGGFQFVAERGWATDVPVRPGGLRAQR